MPANIRILAASGLAPLAAVIPLSFLGALMWSWATTGPLAHSKLSAVSALPAAFEFVLTVYALLAFGLLTISLILRAVESLTRRNMLYVSAAISMAVGALFGGGWSDPADMRSGLPDTVVNVVVQCLVAFAILGAVSIVWCRIALGSRSQARGAGEA